jgi:amino acid efflux transporter
VLVVLGAVAVALELGFDMNVKSTVLLITGSFTLVYVLATAAAVRLLPGRGWARAAALVSLVCSAGLLLLTGVHILWGVALAIAALGYEYWTQRGSRASA